MATRFVFFGGKGGVGKTTCAAAYAVRHASSRRRILIVSTDPAHSLGDALGVRLAARVKPVARGLDAVELDAPRAFARWLADRHAAAAAVLEHGTWLDREDVDTLLDLPIPGIDELVGLLEIDRVSRRYDLVVVDTAPTGHTLRLLAAPDAVRAVAEVLDAMQAEHRVIRAQLARVGRADAADRLIAEIATQARDVAGRLRDPDRTTFRWVTLPEPMSLAESEDAIAALDRAGVRVAEVIVNRVLTDEGPCPICDRRRVEEAQQITRIRRTIGRRRAIRLVPALAAEPTGLRALAAIDRARITRLRAPSVGHGSGLSAPADEATLDPGSLPAVAGAALVFVGGKGGVGKTTIAAALALSLARADRRRRVLLLSTDPAHSLAHVLSAPVGDEPAAVPRAPANLAVRELDAAAALASRRADLDAALNDIAASTGAGAGTAGAAGLMELAPPGVDELFGLLSVFDSRADYDLIVVDTAPTGHALRLLELPGTARAWVQVLLRVLLKYRTLVRPGRLAAELVDVSKSIREFQSVLRDATVTRFVVVTRAAQLPRRETRRLIARLTMLHLAVPSVIVNAMTLAPGRCRRCRRTHAAEQRELIALRRTAGRRGIIRTPLMAPSPRGIRALDAWAHSWLA